MLAVSKGAFEVVKGGIFAADGLDDDVHPRGGPEISLVGGDNFFWELGDDRAGQVDIGDLDPPQDDRNADLLRQSISTVAQHSCYRAADDADAYESYTYAGFIHRFSLSFE